MARAHRPKVLVVEDEALLALDLQCTLEEAGYAVIGSSASVSRAKALIEKSPPDAVLLDVLLESQPDFTLADHLDDRGIPFVFVTVCERSSIATRHARRPLLQKPCTAEQVLTTLRDLIAHESVSINRA
jgi:DNA-binding NtrC family response regulator